MQTKNTAELVKENLREYGLYVIEDRAIADVRDGLKPVQRRLLWCLHSLKRHSTAIPIKCATVIGEAIGKYHPHGDSACYGALVTMAWMRYGLAQKEGNFGSRASLIEAGPAAYRYTETRLSGFADRIFDDIHVMPLIKSFTEEHDEPFLLPTRVPLLLVNGCTGVAVGLATNIPPHNVGEVINAALEVLENPDCTVQDLLRHIKGPDYGSGVLLSKKQDLQNLYTTGQGKLTYSCNYHFEEGTKGKQKLVITGFCPGFKASKLVDKTQELAEAKLLNSIANDEGSMKTGIRVVIDFTDPKIINNRVIPLLQSTQTYQFFALDTKKRPHLYGLKELLDVFLKFRRKVERLVLDSDLADQTRKLLIEGARLIAVDNLKIVMTILNEAETLEMAALRLQEELTLTEDQATIILDTAVKQLLRKVNRESLVTRIDGIKQKIQAIELELQDIDAVVGRRLREMLKYADPRGTKLKGGKEELDTTVTNAWYYVGITEQGRVESATELPIKSKALWPYTGFTCTTDKFAVVSDDNLGQSISLSFIDKFDKSIGKVLGMATETDVCMLVVSKRGRYVAFPPDQRRSQFKVFKDLQDDELVFAGGVGEADKIVVVVEKGDAVVIDAKDLKITRPNVTARPLPELGKRKIQVISVMVIPDTTIAVDIDGKELGEAELRDVAFCVGPENLVVYHDGRRIVKTEEETLNFISGDVSLAKLVFPLKNHEDTNS